MDKHNNLKKRNHQVTKGYLSNWSCDYDEKTKCIWYIDVQKQRVLFSQGEAAGFAVSDWLYVPKLHTGDRNQVLEDWFSSYESELCQLARFSRYGPPKRNVSSTFEEKAIKGCITLGFRSKNKLDKIVDHFRLTRKELSEDQLILASLQSLYNGTISLFEILKKSVFTVAYNLPVNLFSEEDPFHINTLQSGKMLSIAMALSPTSMLVGLPERDSVKSDKLLTGFRLNWLNAKDFPDFSHFYNKSSINGARQWLVCSSKEEAEFLLPEFSKEKVAKRAENDKVGIVMPVPSGIYNALYQGSLP